MNTHRIRLLASLLAVFLLTSVGCWEEIRYDPANPSTVDVPANLSVQSTHVDEDSAPPVVGEPRDDQSEQAPGEPVVEEQPRWQELDSSEPEPVVQKPAPPASLDWLGLEEPETTREESRHALAAWKLGSKWSLAVAIFGKGLGEDRYGDPWHQANYAARLLELELPALPEGVSQKKLRSTALEILTQTAGPELAEQVGHRYSPRLQALCELAIHSHALLLNYSPGLADLDAAATMIRQAGEKSQLPRDLWSPLVELLTERAEFPDVKQAVFTLHTQALALLGTAASP